MTKWVRVRVFLYCAYGNHVISNGEWALTTYRSITNGIGTCQEHALQYYQLEPPKDGAQ